MLPNRVTYATKATSQVYTYDRQRHEECQL